MRMFEGGDMVRLQEQSIVDEPPVAAQEGSQRLSR